MKHNRYKKQKALSSSIQETHTMVAICTLIKSSCDEGMKKVFPVLAYFRFVFLLQDFESMTCLG